MYQGISKYSKVSNDILNASNDIKCMKSAHETIALLMHIWCTSVYCGLFLYISCYLLSDTDPVGMPPQDQPSSLSCAVAEAADKLENWTTSDTPVELRDTPCADSPALKSGLKRVPLWSQCETNRISFYCLVKETGWKWLKMCQKHFQVFVLHILRQNCTTLRVKTINR